MTGGEGFNYEDHVAARFLVDMLSGHARFGVEFGYVTQVAWQVRDTGRLLDDLAISMVSAGVEHVAEISIKRDRQVTSSGFPSHFVEAIWEEEFQLESKVFRKDQDLLVLVTGELANDVSESWSILLNESIAATPDRIVQRLQAPTSADGKNSLISSSSC